MATVDPVEEDSTVFELIKKKLADLSIHFETKHHAAVLTSEEAAAVRGTSIDQGAKAIFIKFKTKADYEYALFVMSASKKLDNKKVKKVLKAKSLSFASANEVKQLTKCLPGAVPPFGSAFNVKTYMDSAFRSIDVIDFNAGLRTDSIEMKRSDYELAEKPEVVELT